MFRVLVWIDVSVFKLDKCGSCTLVNVQNVTELFTVKCLKLCEFHLNYKKLLQWVLMSLRATILILTHITNVPVGSSLHLHSSFFSLLSCHISFCAICPTFLLSPLKIYAFLISSVWNAFPLDLSVAHSLLTVSYSDSIKDYFFNFVSFMVY